MLILKVFLKTRFIFSYMYQYVHALVWCFVGDVPFYIVRNSWGTDFGNNGYLYIKYGENVCGKNSFFEGVLFNISNMKKMCLLRIFLFFEADSFIKHNEDFKKEAQMFWFVSGIATEVSTVRVLWCTLHSHEVPKLTTRGNKWKKDYWKA